MAAGTKRRRARPLLQPPKPKWKRCEASGKRGYATREDAVAATAHFSRSQSYKGQSIYRCPNCRRFHTTTAS
jgi:hypothetical protein